MSRFGASSHRAFTTTSGRYAEPHTPGAMPSSSIPPFPKTRVGGNLKSKTAIPVSMKAAAGLQKVTGKATETYTAYGATENLYKECAAQANYSITQEPNSEEEMPKTEDGEDLGVGDGWWLQGRSHQSNGTASSNKFLRCWSKAHLQYLVAGHYVAHVSSVCEDSVLSSTIA